MMFVCQACNAWFPASTDRCPHCQGVWLRILPKDHATYARELQVENVQLQSALSECRITLVCVAESPHHHPPDEPVASPSPCLACMAVRTLERIETLPANDNADATLPT